jgi:hypothetical protein
LHTEDKQIVSEFTIDRIRRIDMIRARFLQLLTKAGVAALFLAGLATGVKAQDTYQGKFTLPFETHWGGATLPAGDYVFALPTATYPYRLYIRGQATTAIIMVVGFDEKVASGHAQLNLVEIADAQNVQTFEAPELGLTFNFATPTPKHLGRREARQKTTPATAPASQVSVNKTSIAVHAAGR